MEETVICSLCKGAGNLVCFENGKPEWWSCPKCGGSGCCALHGPAEIRIGKTQSEMTRKFGKKLKSLMPVPFFAGRSTPRPHTCDGFSASSRRKRKKDGIDT